MPTIMMALGDYRFGLDSAAYQTLERVTSWRWPSQERLGRLPARQYVGPGEDTLTLAGVIYPHFKGGLRQIDTMRTEAGKGQPLDLTDGTGRVWGPWIILSIRESQSHLLAHGAPLKIDFTIELAAYGEDA